MANKDPAYSAAGRLAMARRYGDKEAERKAERDLAELRAFRLRQRAEEAEKAAARAKQRAGVSS